MVQFVHIFDARLRNKIKRGGIRAPRHSRGIFAMPVLTNHLATHQWLRELRRRRKVPMMAVQFRVPGEEPVHIGRYNEEHLQTTAAQAAAIARLHQAPFGLEVILSGPVSPRAIVRFYVPPKIVGWRYAPQARGREPCPCPYCQRGLPFSQRIRRRYGQV